MNKQSLDERIDTMATFHTNNGIACHQCVKRIKSLLKDVIQEVIGSDDERYVYSQPVTPWFVRTQLRNEQRARLDSLLTGEEQ